MKLKVLGCSGGTAGGMHTTTLVVGENILIDAGTGLIGLDVTQLVKIDHVFLSHSHLDHIATLPFLADIAGSFRRSPIMVYGLAETLDALRRHVFNNVIWPNFTVIPRQNPFLKFREISVGETFEFDECRITPIPAKHVVPAIGYWVDSGVSSLVYTGDTAGCSQFWETVNAIANLRYLIIENSFRNDEIDLAMVSGHLCPELLEKELAQLRRPVEILITHLKPGEVETTMAELARIKSPSPLTPLHQDQVIEF